MATLITKTWLNNIYTSINSIISKYTNGIKTISESSTVEIEAKDINNLLNKLSTMKNDIYLKTEPSLFVSYVAVSSGELISSTTKELLDK